MRMMKRVSVLIGSAAAVTLVAYGTQAAQVRVQVSGMDPVAGNLMIAVHDSKEGMDGNAKPVQAKSAAVTAPQMTVDLGDLKPGTYAIAAYQDVNGNGELDRSFFGAPKEPFGFSNNAMGRRGPPDFSQAAFTVKGEAVSQTIKLVDFRKLRR